MTFQLMNVLQTVIDPIPENGEPISEYHNAALRYNFDRLFAASAAAYKGAIKREQELRETLSELMERDPDMVNRKTGYTFDNLEKAIQVTNAATEIDSEFQSIYLALTGTTFDHDNYTAQWNTPKPTGENKERAQRAAALLAAE